MNNKCNLDTIQDDVFSKYGESVGDNPHQDFSKKELFKQDLKKILQNSNLFKMTFPKKSVDFFF